MRFLVSVLAIAIAPIAATSATTPLGRAVLSSAQVVPQTDNHARGFASLWFDNSRRKVTFRLAEFVDLRRGSLTTFERIAVSKVSVHCAPAGVAGPQLFDLFSLPAVIPGVPTISEYGQRIVIGEEDILPQDKSGPCGLAINTLDSLESAALARRLYVLADTELGTIRGQIWPRNPSITVTPAKLSARQVVEGPREANSNSVSLEIKQGFKAAWVTAQARREAVSLTLNCAPAGENGPVVAMLLANSGPLRNEDIIPTSGDEVCGMTVNNLASLAEAVSLGRIYAIQTFASGGAIRGQFRCARTQFSAFLLC